MEDMNINKSKNPNKTIYACKGADVNAFVKYLMREITHVIQKHIFSLIKILVPQLSFSRFFIWLSKSKIIFLKIQV